MKVFDGFGLSVEGELTPEVAIAVKKLAVDTRLEAEARGLLQHRKYVRLPNGGYAHSVKHGPIVRVRAVTTGGVAASGEAFGYPGFVSGVVSDFETSPPIFTPAPSTIEKLGLTNESAVAHREPRFTVAAVQDGFGNQCQVHPNLYSGRMSQAVQLVLGYGKPPLRDSRYVRALRRARVSPEAIRDAVQNHSAFLGLAENGVRMYYDFSWYRTHGIGVAPDNKKWLVEIGDRGVLARPLPYWPYTDTQAFRDSLAGIDAEAQYAVDQLGGLPTGEAIPPDETLLASMKRAGEVLTLMPASGLSEVLGMLPSSSAYGWAFNMAGSEAHCVSFRDEPLPQATAKYSVHWQLDFSLPETNTTPATAMQQQLTARVRRVAPRGVQREVWINKVRRLSDSQAATVLGVANSADMLAALDTIDLAGTQPSGTAYLRKAGEGYAFAGAGAFRVWEPLLDQTVLFDLRPIDTLLSSPAFVYLPQFPDLVDAPVHVWFDGNELCQLRVFNRRGRNLLENYDSVDDNAAAANAVLGASTSPSTTSFGYAYTEGQVGQYVYSGSNVTLNNGPSVFYSLRLDLREELSAFTRRFNTANTTVTGSRSLPPSDTIVISAISGVASTDQNVVVPYLSGATLPDARGGWMLDFAYTQSQMAFAGAVDMAILLPFLQVSVGTGTRSDEVRVGIAQELPTAGVSYVYASGIRLTSPVPPFGAGFTTFVNGTSGSPYSASEQTAYNSFLDNFYTLVYGGFFDSLLGPPFRVRWNTLGATNASLSQCELGGAPVVTRRGDTSLVPLNTVNATFVGVV